METKAAYSKNLQDGLPTVRTHVFSANVLSREGLYVWLSK
jgi:hypothetical protein